MSSVDYGQCRSLTDFAPRYMFDVTFIRRPSGVAIPNDFKLRCIGTAIPVRTPNEPDEVFVHGHRISQPGVEDTSGTLALTLFENVDGPVKQLISTWRNLNRNNNDGIMAPRSQVTADLRIKLLNRQKQPWWIYDVRDAWISDESQGELDATQRSGIMNDIGITLTYDHFDEGPS